MSRLRSKRLMNQTLKAKVEQKTEKEIVVKEELVERPIVFLLSSGIRRRDVINAIANDLITRKAFKCLVCERIFMKNNNLRKHIEAVHIKNKIFVCDICDKGYQLKPWLRKHIEKYHFQFPVELESKSIKVQSLNAKSFLKRKEEEIVVKQEPEVNLRQRISVEKKFHPRVEKKG